MRPKIIEMIFGANQGFIVHSPRLRLLFATRHYSFIKHHAMNLLTSNKSKIKFFKKALPKGFFFDIIKNVEKYTRKRSPI